ncbi:MAG: sulfotransferase domain-containing protein [Rhodospirillales bacterium]|nr:sulfotransferase domain-containing protein [Rhodospirillales bacterium]
MRNDDFSVDFVIGGCRKAGTSWLYEVLRSNPEVCLCEKVKESHFFTTKFGKGLDWYRSLFPSNLSGLAVGEIDPSIFIFPEAVSNIKSTFPDTKLIFILRRPPDLAHSGYMFSLREGTVTGTEQERWEQSPYARRDVSFFTVLRPFYEHFGADKILITIFDDLKQHPEAFYKRVCEFVGVETSADPLLFSRKFNAAARSRVQWLTAPVQRLKRLARQTDMHWLVNTAKQFGGKRLFNMLFPAESTRISPEMEQIIIRDTYDEVAKASELIGIDLVSMWRYDKAPGAPSP